MTGNGFGKGFSWGRRQPPARDEPTPQPTPQPTPPAAATPIGRLGEITRRRIANEDARATNALDVVRAILWQHVPALLRIAAAKNRPIAQRVEAHHASEIATAAQRASQDKDTSK